MNENYYKTFIHQTRLLRSKKPKLLIHICCGACSCYPLIFLMDLYDITIYFSNSNIYPLNEFNIRLNALRKYVDFLNEKFNKKIRIIIDKYDYKNFKKDLEPYAYEKEHGNRCKICILKRMKRLFEYAKKHDFNVVSTVMSISRNKNADYLNSVGKSLEKEYKNITFLVADFKKNNGQDLGVLISKKFDVYRQDYCGCEYSKNNQNLNK